MNNPMSAEELAEFRAFIAPPTVTATSDGKEKLLVTCAGKISCNRCQGTSRRTKLQCGNPALKSSKTQKCKFHGGASTGARTVEGRQRISASLLVHGRETNTARAKRQLKTLELRQLEDIMALLGMVDGVKRTAGTKPAGYRQIKTIAEAQAYIIKAENLPAGALGDASD
jgi:hypothetical protein